MTTTNNKEIELEAGEDERIEELLLHQQNENITPQKKPTTKFFQQKTKKDHESDILVEKNPTSEIQMSKETPPTNNTFQKKYPAVTKTSKTMIPPGKIPAVQNQARLLSKNVVLDEQAYIGDNDEESQALEDNEAVEDDDQDSD
jgi:hypothetical protein